MLCQLCLDRSRLPNLLDEAHLFSSIADQDLKCPSVFEGKLWGSWNTYVILIDIISWGIKDLVLVDTNVDSLTLGVVTWTSRKNGGSRNVILHFVVRITYAIIAVFHLDG